MTVLTTLPFPRLDGVKGLTWTQCFNLDREGIKSQFLEAIAQKATKTADNPVRRLVTLLLAMTNENQSQPQSTAVITDHPGFIGDQYAKIVPLQLEIEASKLGRVNWSPKGTTLKLWCHSIFDLLGACMSDATWIPSSDPAQQARTKDNYFAPLASLYSYWCFRLVEVGNRDRRPAMTGIACVGDVTVLQCSIPSVPGVVANKAGGSDGKELIRRSRFADLQSRGRQEGSDKQILDLEKVKAMKQSYGNCAETWSFILLASQKEENLQKVYGVAVKIPSKNVTDYKEEDERIESTDPTKQRYAPLCLNCSRLITQVALWGPLKKATVVKNFNVMEWTLK